MKLLRLGVILINYKNVCEFPLREKRNPELTIIPRLKINLPVPCQRFITLSITQIIIQFPLISSILSGR